MSIVSCGVSNKLKKADAVYEAGGYDKAANLYRKVAPKIKNKQEKASIYFKSAEAYRKSGNFTSAGRSFDQAIRNNYPDAIVFLRNGQMALMAENMDKLQKQLESYKALEPTNQQGIVLQKSYELASSSQPSTAYIVEGVKSLNTRFHDFAPSYASSDYESLVFTSSRREGKGKIKTHDATGQKNTDLYKATLSKTGWNKPYPLDNTINTLDEEGATVFNYNYSTLYFTRCSQERGEKYGCSIMFSRTHGDGWSDPENLKLAHDSMVVAHPALSDDGLTMYFTSNIRGGYGGLDIWQVSRSSEDNNLWSDPINLGAQINTPGDEMFPFVRKDTLYFSSTGHPGYGGLDIYKAYRSLGNWVVENMGKPINSNADDFGIIFEKENERGYFSSRRKGSGGDDIYSFRLNVPVIEYSFEGSVRDAKTNTRLARVEVVLSGSDGTTLRKTTERDGTFQFRLSSNTDYVAVARRQGYFAQKSDLISTEGLKESKTFAQNLLMTSYVELVEIPNIFFEFGKADLSNESTEALDNLITLMNDNPKIVVSLIAHTDNRGTDDSNMILSQRRAQSVVDYLIVNGIDNLRLMANGLGESYPRKITAEIAGKYPFLKSGQTLTEQFINSLSNEEQKEICHALNRRTEIQVLSDDYEAE